MMALFTPSVVEGLPLWNRPQVRLNALRPSAGRLEPSWR